jgi:MFS family permease
MTAYSVGTVTGQPIIGALMDHHGPASMPVALAAASALVMLAAAAGRHEWSPSCSEPRESVVRAGSIP